MSRITTIRKTILKWFTAHPESIGETYFQHFRFAAWIGIRVTVAGLACLVHSVFPFVFETTASDIIKNIMQEIEKRKNKILRN